MSGRWPANVILSPAMAEALDEQAPNTGSWSPKGATYSGHPETDSHIGGLNKESQAHYGDMGGASRFFLQAGYEPWELEWILANGLRPCGMEEV